MPFNPFSALTSKIFGAAALALLLAAAFLWWRLDAKSEALGEAKAELAAAEAEIELLKLDADLKETAATEREADNDALRNEERELQDARTHEGDDADTRRIRRLCVVLRQQGRDTSDVPACAGLGG
jgi:Flp pilus assembly protein TadB